MLQEVCTELTSSPALFVLSLCVFYYCCCSGEMVAIFYGPSTAINESEHIVQRNSRYPWYRERIVLKIPAKPSRTRLRDINEVVVAVRRYTFQYNIYSMYTLYKIHSTDARLPQLVEMHITTDLRAIDNNMYLAFGRYSISICCLFWSDIWPAHRYRMYALLTLFGYFFITKSKQWKRVSDIINEKFRNLIPHHGSIVYSIWDQEPRTSLGYHVKCLQSHKELQYNTKQRHQILNHKDYNAVVLYMITQTKKVLFMLTNKNNMWDIVLVQCMFTPDNSRVTSTHDVSKGDTLYKTQHESRWRLHYRCCRREGYSN